MNEGLPPRTAPLPPERPILTSHPLAPWLFLAIFVALLVAIACFYIAQHSSSPAQKQDLSAYFTELYFSPGNDGLATWYQKENGTLAQHAMPVPGSVTGFARAGTAIYFSIAAFAPSTASAVYRYESGAYTKVYDSADRISGLSASSDGTFLGITGAGKDGKNAGVVDLSSASTTLTLLGDSLPIPQFLSIGNTHAVLYASGTQLMERTYANGQWQKPVKVYGSLGATMATFATDGDSHFSFVDPDKYWVREWETTSLSPFAATSTAMLDPMPGLALIYSGHTVFGYAYTSRDIANRFHDLMVKDFSNDESYSYTPPAQLDAVSSVFLLSSPQSP